MFQQQDKYHKINYFNIECVIGTQKEVKICGITFSLDSEAAYAANVTDKIHKLENVLNLWRQRNLTMEERQKKIKERTNNCKIAEEIEKALSIKETALKIP